MQTKDRPEMDARSETRDQSLNCWKAGSNPLCLRIEFSDGTQFMLPYGYFEGARFAHEGDIDVLCVEFKAHRFTIRGSFLEGLFTAFQSLSVERLKERPRRYQALAQKAQSYIESIEQAKTDE